MKLSGKANVCSFSKTVRREWFSWLWAKRRFRMSLQKMSMPYEFSRREDAPPTFSTRDTTPRGTSTSMGMSRSVDLNWRR